MRTYSELAHNKVWKILVVDDEPDVRAVTRLVLNDYIFDGKVLEFIECDSAKSAIEILSKVSDIALILLDVVMERDDAGLDVVKFLRDNLKNHSTRIIIRTGQPGEFPESTIVENYEINDYKVKTELTEEHLKNVITVALRSYCDIMTTEYYKNNLQKLVDQKTAELKELNDLLKIRIDTEMQCRIEKEKLLIQQSKMATIGEMLSIIAHQWSQPISTMSMLAADLKVQAATEQNNIYIADVLKQQISYMGKTLRDFSQFFKPSKEKSFFNVVDTVEVVTGLLEYTLKQNMIQVRLDFDSKPLFELFGYKNEFEQVVLNILKNSIDAISEIQSLVDPFDRISQAIYVKFFETDTHIGIEFVDQAGGIPQHILDRVFEMYFTTKGEEKGTGIGLYMVKMIIEESFDGKVTAKNSGEGAAIELLFHKVDRHESE